MDFSKTLNGTPWFYHQDPSSIGILSLRSLSEIQKNTRDWISWLRPSRFSVSDNTS
jgi:hypothetical protein